MHTPWGLCAHPAINVKVRLGLTERLVVGTTVGIAERRACKHMAGGVGTSPCRACHSAWTAILHGMPPASPAGATVAGRQQQPSPNRVSKRGEHFYPVPVLDHDPNVCLTMLNMQRPRRTTR
eukprot:361414-Chlamydomonas_euryale.AAC.4